MYKRRLDVPLTYLLLLLACLLSTYVSCKYWKRLTFTTSVVVNTPDRVYFRMRDPPGFVRQHLQSTRLATFRQHLPVLREEPLSMERAVRLRQWARVQQTDGASMWTVRNDTGNTDPNVLLQEQREGVPGACRRFAYVLVGALLADGYHARVAGFASGFDELIDTTHTVAEAWIPQLNKWVMLDATFDITFLVDGRPASVLELHDLAAGDGRTSLSVQYDGLNRAPYWKATAKMLGMYRHITVATSSAIFDGYGVGLFKPKRLTFVHLVDSMANPYPNGAKAIVAFVCLSSAAAIAAIALRQSRAVFYERSVHRTQGHRYYSHLADEVGYSLRRRAQKEGRIQGHKRSKTVSGPISR